MLAGSSDSPSVVAGESLAFEEDDAEALAGEHGGGGWSRRGPPPMTATSVMVFPVVPSTLT